MVVIVVLLPYLLTYIFILKNICYFRTCYLWTGFQRHILLALRKYDKSKSVSGVGFFLIGAILVLNVLFSKFGNCGFTSPTRRTPISISTYCTYSTQQIFQSTTAPLRNAEDSIPKTSFYWFRTETIWALTVFPSYCKNLCSWYVDNVLVVCSGDWRVTA